MTVEEKIDLQNQYCKDNGVPRFSPGDGRCFGCGNQIYDGIEGEVAAKELITGCPYCKRSFVG